MKLITLHLPEPYIKDLDELVHDDHYPNRAEAIRIAVRDMLANELWERKRLNVSDMKKNRRF
jgi:Arc/MetJ-type ribon-helix-helix transcriptional regulator